MNWPTPNAYAAAVQHPRAAFSDPDLKCSIPTNDANGKPAFIAGNFASVFRLKNESDSYAVRCFTRRPQDQERRYTSLAKYCANRELPFLIPFEFEQQGVRVDDIWYPIVKMQWAQGLPLHEFVEQHLNQPARIELLSINWRELASTLEENHLAHGDLQHTNILVSPDGELKLVDYDGMFAPMFAEGKSPELGHPNYQHPMRNSGFYDERLDRFTSLLIYLSLKAISVDPTLWREFHTGDNLIVSVSDLRVAETSRLWPRLLDSANEEVQKLTLLLTDFLKVPPMNLPDLESILESSIRAIVVPLDSSALGSREPTPFAHAMEASAVRKTPTKTALPARAFEIAGWSAVLFAGLALLPPFQLICGTLAVMMAVLSIVLPGRRFHHNRFVALVALLFGLTRLATPPNVAVSARESSAPHLRDVAVNSAPVVEPTQRNGQTVSTIERGTSPGPNIQFIFPNSTNAFLGTEQVRPDSADFKELQSVAPILDWQAHEQPITSVAFSGDGRHVVTSSNDGTLAIWNASSGLLIHRIKNPASEITDLHSLTNIGIFASTERDASIRWWSIDGGVPLKEMTFNAESSFPPTISPDGQLIALPGANERAIRFVNAHSEELSVAINGFSSDVRKVVFSGNSQFAAVLRADNTISVHAMSDGSIRGLFNFPSGPIDRVLLSPSGERIAAFGTSRLVRIWSTAEAHGIIDVELAEALVETATFSNDGRWLFVSAKGGTIERISMKDGDIQKLNAMDQTGFTSVRVSPAGLHLASGTASGHVSIWKTAELVGGTEVEQERH